MFSMRRQRINWVMVVINRTKGDGTLVDDLKWNGEGLIPAIVQDAETGEVLMMAWMDRPSLNETITSGQTHFYSRSRKTHWHKGGTSGHVQHVEEIRVDCDQDVLLLKVRQVGGACHEGYLSCFFRKLSSANDLAIDRDRVFDPAEIYRNEPAERSGK